MTGRGGKYRTDATGDDRRMLDAILDHGLSPLHDAGDPLASWLARPVLPRRPGDQRYIIRHPLGRATVLYGAYMLDALRREYGPTVELLPVRCAVLDTCTLGTIEAA